MGGSDRDGVVGPAHDALAMWNVLDEEENDFRALEHDNPPLTVIFLAPDIARAAAAPTRAAFQAGLEDVLRQSQAKNPPKFTHDDLDRIRAPVGGAAFQRPPTFKRSG